MKTQYYTASTIDGYIADGNHSLDWLFQFGEMESMADDYPRFIEQVGAIAMGSSTYTWILDHENLLDEPEKWPYDLPAWVFTSRERAAVPGADIRFVEGDAAPVHAEMVKAAGGKNIWIAGGGDLVGQFHDQGLLDELIIALAPVTLGAGAPLLPRAITSPPLKLSGVQQHGDVFVVLTYAVQR